MIKNGKEFDEKLLHENKKVRETVFEFLDKFEQENHISIRLREKDLIKCEKYVKEELGLNNNQILNNEILLPFEWFELNGNSFRLYIKAEGESGDFAIALVTKNKQKVMWCALYSYEDGSRFGVTYGDRKEYENICQCIIGVKWVMAYLHSMKKKYKKSEKPNKEIKVREKAEKEKSKSKIHYITVDDAVSLMHQTKESGYKVTCECYGVRGHYRHYKTGKIVFIKPYLKGTKRNESKPVMQEYGFG